MVIIGKFWPAITLIFLGISCFRSPVNKYVVVHERTGVYRSVEELVRSTVRGHEDVRASFVLSKGEQVKYINDGYTKQFMYIHIETKSGERGFIFNSVEVNVFEVG